MARSPSRSRSRSPRKGERRRERDYRGGDRERERDRGYERERDRDLEIRSRGDRGRLARDRDRRGDRGDRGGDRGDRGGRTRERERGRSGSPPRRDHQREHSGDYEIRRDASSGGRGRSRDAGGGNELAEVEKLLHKKETTDRRDDGIMKDSEGQRAAIVAEFVDGIVREHEQFAEASLHSSPRPPPPSGLAAPQPDEEDLMKKMEIPVGFNTSKGKYVGDANHSAVKLTTKRQPRQYMNRRGGFNRPLPAETNR